MEENLMKIPDKRAKYALELACEYMPEVAEMKLAGKITTTKSGKQSATGEVPAEKFYYQGTIKLGRRNFLVCVNYDLCKVVSAMVATKIRTGAAIWYFKA